MWEQRFNDMDEDWHEIDFERVKKLAKANYKEPNFFLWAVKSHPGKAYRLSPFSFVRWTEEEA